MTRTALSPWAWLCVAALLALPLHARAAEADPPAHRADVLIYGGTPAGIAAALEAARAGRSVVLVEPYSWVGGLVTNGLTHTDFHSFEGLTGAYLEFAQRVRQHYVDKYGPDSEQVKQCFRGTHAEPHVNLAVFRAMLGEHENIRVVRDTRLIGVGTQGSPRRIAVARFVDANDRVHAVAARMFIDATYEGDLMAMAGVEYAVGRESKDAYGESLAPDEADGKVQGYNFRLCMTQREDIRVPAPKPDGYDRADFTDLIPLMEQGKLKSVFCYPSGGIYKDQIPPLPNGKVDINDVSRGLVRLSLPQINDAWPDGDAATRATLFAEHVRHNVGMLYFLQNDDAVPAKFRDEARRWGFCKDEFVETGHLPQQLYVREARRMVGMHVFIEGDTDHADGDARAVLHEDAITMGEYGPNCHGTDHTGPRIGGRHTGEFYKRVPPYQIPYGVIVPREVENLLVPVAASSSHVGFCALRLEPIWMSLGQAAGVAASLAIEHDQPVQKVSPAEMRTVLHARGAATIYVTDVPPGHADFAAVQWWGAAGGLHGLHPIPDEPGARGKHLIGQYYEANPGHTVDLDTPLDAATRTRWTKLASDLGVDAEGLGAATTRGAFIRAAYTARP